MKQTTLFACEGQPIVLEGLTKVLGESAEVELVGSAHTVSDAVAPIEALRPDVILLDQSGGLKSMFQFISIVRQRSPKSQTVLWVGELEEVECFRALQVGARGILKKSLPVSALLECVRAVANGSLWIEHSISNQVVGCLNRKAVPRLTPREREIVRLICRGMKNRQVAEALSITPGTVKVHLMHIFEKTGVRDRFELVVQARRFLSLDLGEDFAGLDAGTGSN